MSKSGNKYFRLDLLLKIKFWVIGAMLLSAFYGVLQSKKDNQYTTISYSGKYYIDETLSPVITVRKLSNDSPLENATVRFRLSGPKTVILQGVTDDNGTYKPAIKLLPSFPAGEYQIQIVTKSPYGYDKITRKFILSSQSSPKSGFAQNFNLIKVLVTEGYLDEDKAKKIYSSFDYLLQNNKLIYFMHSYKDLKEYVEIMLLQDYIASTEKQKIKDNSKKNNILKFYLFILPGIIFLTSVLIVLIYYENFNCRELSKFLKNINQATADNVIKFKLIEKICFITFLNLGLLEVAILSINIKFKYHLTISIITGFICVALIFHQVMLQNIKNNFPLKSLEFKSLKKILYNFTSFYIYSRIFIFVSLFICQQLRSLFIIGYFYFIYLFFFLPFTNNNGSINNSYLNSTLPDIQNDNYNEVLKTKKTSFVSVLIIIPVLIICFAIIILASVFNTGHKPGRIIICSGDFKQLSLAVRMYESDNDIELLKMLQGGKQHDK